MAALIAVEGAELAAEGAELALPELEEAAGAAGKEVKGIASSIVTRAKGLLGVTSVKDVGLGVGIGQAFGSKTEKEEPPKSDAPAGAAEGGKRGGGLKTMFAERQLGSVFSGRRGNLYFAIVIILVIILLGLGTDFWLRKGEMSTRNILYGSAAAVVVGASVYHWWSERYTKVTWGLE